MLFKEKVILITGASGGIGSVTARLFAENGANIVINYLSSTKKAEETLNMVKSLGVEAIKIKADISKPNEVKDMFANTIKEFGKIDVLVNNASKHPPPIFEFHKPDWELWKEMVRVNMMGIIVCSHFSFSYLKETNGNIVNVVMDYDPGGLGYVLTKTAGTPLTRGLAKELAPIRVNAVSPGVIETWEMSENEKAEWLKTIIIKRIGQPLDIAKAILFLASDDAAYITGETLHVDGGRQLLV
ncbi:MAG: SDR family NAD(P)-dependent oxidoreductase [Candidatus Hodarchaeota archaeon]